MNVKNKNQTIKLQDEINNAQNNNVSATFEISSNQIKIPLHNLVKYSQKVQEEFFKKNEILSELNNSIQKVSIKHNNSINTFLQLLNDEEIEMKKDEFIDLMKLSEFFKVEILKRVLKKYLRNHTKDIDFILSLKIEEENSEEEIGILNDHFSEEMKEYLKENINKCLENDKIKQISVLSIYRMIEGCYKERLSNDLLCHFIIESIKERHVLFHFVEVEKLSEEVFEELIKTYSKLNTSEQNQTYYFDFLPIKMSYVNKLFLKQKSLEKRNEELEEEISKMKTINEKQKTLHKNEIKLKKEEISKMKTINEQQEILHKNEIKRKEEEISKMKAINEQQEILHKNEIKGTKEKKSLKNKSKSHPRKVQNKSSSSEEKSSSSTEKPEKEKSSTEEKPKILREKSNEPNFNLDKSFEDLPPMKIGKYYTCRLDLLNELRELIEPFLYSSQEICFLYQNESSVSEILQKIIELYQALDDLLDKLVQDIELSEKFDSVDNFYNTNNLDELLQLLKTDLFPLVEEIPKKFPTNKKMNKKVLFKDFNPSKGKSINFEKNKAIKTPEDYNIYLKDELLIEKYDKFVAVVNTIIYIRNIINFKENYVKLTNEYTKNEEISTKRILSTLKYNAKSKIIQPPNVIISPNLQIKQQGKDNKEGDEKNIKEEEEINNKEEGEANNKEGGEANNKEGGENSSNKS